MAAGVADELRCQVDRAVEALEQTRSVFERIRERGDEAWRGAGLVGCESLLGLDTRQPWRRTLLERLIDLEIATAAVADGRRPDSTVPIDLVQVSLSAKGPLLDPEQTGDDKLAGPSLGHFGGFLKRSWRVNDWIWGRLDAATILVRTVLTDEHLERALRGVERPEAVVEQLVHGVYQGCVLPGRLGELREEAMEAARQGFPGGNYAPLVDFCVAVRQLEVMGEELGHLAEAVVADRIDGAGSRSNGEAFVQNNRALLDRLRSGVVSVQDRLDALAAFDRAGIGREPLAEEAGSDLIARTTVRAAAVATTVFDSSELGTGVVKPISKTVRGAMLLPYWVITGLSRGNGLARFLALMALVVGGVLLGVSLLGVLPGPLAAPGALLGLGAFLTGLGYAALRSGSLVHTALLLLPVSPLLAYASARFAASAGDTPSVLGISSVVLVLAVVAVLVVLASVRTPIHSPLGALRAAWDWVRPPVGVSGARSQFAVRVVAGLCVVVVATVAVVFAVQVGAGTGWPQVVARVPVWFRIALVALPFVVGFIVAFRAGLWLRLWRRGPLENKWKLHPVRHQAGVSAGWSFVYGLLYAGLAWLSIVLLGRVELREVTGTPEEKAAAATVNGWHWALLGLGIGSTVLAMLLLLVVPILIPARARRVLTQSLISDPLLGPAVRTRNGLAERARLIVATLERRGATYRYLVTPKPDDPAALGAAPAAMDIVATIVRGTRRPWCPVPVSVHIVAAAISIGAAVALQLGYLPAVGAWISDYNGSIWLPIAGVAWLMLLALVEGRRLGPEPRPDAALPAFWPAAGSVLGLLAIAAGAARWEPWPVDAKACALLLTVLLALVAGLQVLGVLYTRRMFCRRASTQL